MIRNLLSHFSDAPWYEKSVFVSLVFLPWLMGAFVFFSTGRLVFSRIVPHHEQLSGITYELLPDSSLYAVPIPALIRQSQDLADSLRGEIPYTYGTPISPFELRIQMDPGSRQVAYLLHCRMWCDCNSRLTDSTFELLIYQLIPEAFQSKLIADTIMSWSDYVKPFTLKPNKKEVIK